MRGSYWVFVEKPGGNELLSRRRCKLGLELKSTSKLYDEGMGWIDLVQDRDRWSFFASAVQKIQLLKKCWEFLC
jgi:hypothetical protein